MSLFGTGRREGCLAIALLALLAFAVHARGLVLGQPRLAVDPQRMPPHARIEPAAHARLDTEAAVNQTILVPAMQAAGNVLRDGELPLWNDTARFGEPFSLSGAPLMYPPFWVLMLPEPWWWLELLCALHCALACAAMYLFLRAMPLQRFTAFLGGGSYGLGWVWMAQLDRLPEAAAAAWVPLALMVSWRTLTSRGRGAYLPWLALALAVPFWTGGTTVAWLGALGCAAVFGCNLGLIDSCERRHALRVAGLAAALALPLTAPLWLESAQLAGTRAPPTLEAGGHLQLAGLLGLGSAEAFGGLHGAAGDVVRDLNPNADPIELVLYPGAGVLFLLLLGLLRPKRRWFSLFWIVTAGIGVLLAMDSPITGWIASWTGLRTGLSGASLWLANLALVLLASFSIENFLDAPLRRRGWTFATIGICGAACAAAAILLMAEGAGARLLHRLADHAEVTEIGPAQRAFFAGFVRAAIPASMLAIAFLLWHRFGILRFKLVLATTVLGDLVLLALFATPRAEGMPGENRYAAAVPHTAGRVLPTGRGMLPPAGNLMAAGLRTVTTDGTSVLDRTARFLNLVDPTLISVGPRARGTALTSAVLLDHPLVGAAGVDVAVSALPVASESLVPLTTAPAGTIAGGALFVATRPQPSPRATMRFHAVPAQSIDQAAQVLGSMLHDPRETVVVERPPEGFTPRRPGTPVRVELIRDSAREVTLDVDVGNGCGYLVLADAFAPGWSAEIDGAATPIYAANLAFRAVAVPEGKHTVRFRYRPWSALLGIPLCLGGIVLVLVSGVWSLRRR